MYSIKHDKYRDARGGHSRILDITCRRCSGHISYYQKDGPGSLRRMYADRMIDLQPTGKVLACGNCQEELGIKITYEKEDRPAYRLFVEAVNKAIVSRRKLPL